MSFFTFGREHEINCSLRSISGEQNTLMAINSVNAAHDYLDGSLSAKSATEILAKNVIEGGSGVWEQATSWLRKISQAEPQVSSIWLELAKHKSAKVRFRVVSSLNFGCIAEPLHQDIIELFLSDRSNKVKSFMQEILDEAENVRSVI